MSGKGSKPRPYSVDQKTFDANWNRIFNNSKSPEYQNTNEDEEMYSHETVDQSRGEADKGC